MSMEDEEYSPYGAYSSGCDIHGENFLRECTMCGIEFCAACFPNSALCSDCAAQAELLDDDEIEPTEEEKELTLLEGFNDDEPPPETETPPAPAKKAPQAKAKPAPKAAAPKAKAKAAAKQPAPKAKRAAPKAKKPAPKKPAPKKRKG